MYRSMSFQLSSQASRAIRKQFQITKRVTQSCNFSASNIYQKQKGSKGKKGKDLSSLVVPVPITPEKDPDGIDVGSELAGEITKAEVRKVLSDFYRRKEIKLLSAENGLDEKLFHQVHVSFRRYCIESKILPTDLHIVLSDILQGAGHIDDIFPFFLGHAKYMFPHLDCKEDLTKISDLTVPANWYPEARNIRRKIIYHAGPTNSGKTYHALNRLFTAESGIYCGPLRMLANEVFHKSNETGTMCDLVTGEERKMVRSDGQPANHVSCTLEMTSVTTPYEVAVIDEIQMMRDRNRGWAWTRALLGLCAKEIHVCGEPSAVDFISELVLDTGDEFEVNNYKRLTKLTILNDSIDSFDALCPGDCIVCFNKNDIYHVARQIEKRNVEVAVIYGTLPPGAKINQANRFNDPDNPCKILVATDAIGMGLNLNIKRVIFYSLVKPTINENGEKEIDVISPSTALQIAGRAGRFGTAHDEGFVTTFKANDLPLLKKLLDADIDPLQQAGLHPTADQIELFSYHLPKATLSNILDIFVTVCQLDNDKYFLCDVADFKFLADMIEHIPLPLKARYVFCCAPIPKKQAFVCTMFLKFARQYSRQQPITLEWLCKNIDWPFKPPKMVADLTHLEGVFDIMDTYLWLSYRFPEMFPDTSHVRDMQVELDDIIRTGVANITKLLINSESGITQSDDDGFEMKTKSSLKSHYNSHNISPSDKSISDLSAKAVISEIAKDTAFDSRILRKDGRSLKERLVEEGILSEEVLKALMEELHSTKSK